MKKIFTLLTILTCLAFTNLEAQVTFSGTIVDDASLPLSGVVVSTDDATTFTTTDENGQFSIEVGELPVSLKFEFLGFVPVERIFTQVESISLQLHEAPIVINEILVAEKSNGSGVTISAAKKVQNAKTINDLFGDVPGMNLVKRGNYATEPVLRGFKYDRLNIQYDGAAKIVHACPNHMDPITSHVIPEEIEKIEIIKGPFDVRYGATLGGIINLVTARPARLNTGLHGNVSLGYGTNGSNLSTTGSISYVDKKYDAMLDVSYRDYGDYDDGNGDLVPAAFETKDVAFKLGFNPSAKQRIQANYRYSGTFDIAHPGLPMDSPHDIGQMAGLDYSYRNASSVFSKFTAKTYYSYVDHLMTNENRPNFKVVDASTPVFATSFGGKLEAVLTPNKKMFWYLGTDLTNTNRTGSRTRLLKRNPKNPMIIFDPAKVFVDSVWGNSTISDMGVYAQGKFYVTPKLEIQSGIRVDFVTGDIAEPAIELTNYYGEIKTQHDANISGNVTASYLVAPLTRLKLSLGRGTRSGGMIERYINHFSVGSDAYELFGNPNLLPETNHQVELALAGKINNFRYGVSGFYALLDNYIEAVVDTNIKRKFTPWLEPKYVKRFVNFDQARQNGFEMYLGYTFAKHWVVNADMAYTKGEIVASGDPLPQIAPLESNISFGYKSKAYWATANYRIVSEQTEVSKAFGEVASPSFEVIDLNVGAVLFNNLTLGLTVNNLLDEAYYEHLNFRYKNTKTNKGFILEQGRNFALFAKYKF